MRPFLFTLITLFATLLTAQEDLTVSILDPQNQPVPNVPVQLKNEARGFEQVQETNAQGKATFRSLPVVDGYQVFVPNFLPFRATQSGLINLRSNQNRTVQLVLSETSISLGEVTVSAASTAKINRTDAEVSFELSQKEIEALPIEGRDITRALYRLPNVSQATGFYPEAPNVSINGANSLFTSYLIDGLDNNERFLGGQKFAIPVGFTKDITVLTNNYSAEYGLTNNGVINITTRSGSNEFSGEAFVINRPGPALDASSPFAQRDLSGNAVKDGFQRYQAGVGFGGAIKKDKTFYYLNLEHTTDLKDNLLNSPALGVNETVRGENRFSYLSGKIDQIWSSKFRSSLRANVGIVAIERQGGGLEGGVQFPSAANFQDRNSVLLASKNTYVSGNFSSETNLQYARFRWNYGRAANESSPQVTVLDPQEQAIAVLGHPGYIFDATENTVQFLQKFKYYADRHTLKGGFGITSADHGLLGGGNVNGNYTVKLDASQLNQLVEAGHGSDLGVNDIPADVEVRNYNVELRPASFGKTQNVFSVYLEDQFAATDRLNLTLGLRYDYDNLSKGGSDQGDLNNLAPRFNFNYQLDRRSSLRGGYGIFYDKILYAVYSDALQQNTTDGDYKRQLQQLVKLGILPADTDLDRITFDGNLSGSASNVQYLNGPTFENLQGQRAGVFSNERRILNPNGYDNPLTHQIALGYQLQLDEKRLFYVDLVHNRSQNLFRLRNLNAAAAYPLDDPDNVTVRTPAEADASRPIPIFGGGYALIDGDTVFGVARNVVVSETAGESRYYGASFNLQQDRGTGKLAWRINYTLSYLENNTEDINFRAMDGNDFGSEWGPSINDRRHILNGIVTWYPVGGLGVTLAGLVQSGQPVNRIPDALLYGTTDLNGDGASFGDAYVGNSDRHPGESRNSDRLDWSKVFDLGVQYDFTLGKNTLQLRADVFNLFNTTNLSGYSNNATQSNQIQVGGKERGIVEKNAGAPRQFQFGARWVF
ncbi:MAG: TonB-dependent receptor plug domain-containing protein [Bacteroidetes bacterium]|nr:TonB-dependent receptor plug domain-containing protein [Bacteroidota bacterium]